MRSLSAFVLVCWHGSLKLFRKMDSSITIVTAYFDIGRGEWTAYNGFSPHLKRTADDYFSYFNNLAQLDNRMVVFTSCDLKPKVEKIRRGKPTIVIAIDIDKKFRHIKKRIAAIQSDPAFLSKLVTCQLINPEYWSADYVLVCNLKAWFVNQAIRQGLVKGDLIAWIDFGYCRTPDTINGISRWCYPFDKQKMHFFTIRRGLKVKTLNSVFEHMMGNHVYAIGGAVIGGKEIWPMFCKLVCQCQKKTLDSHIIDDDQGIFLMCYHYRPDLIRLNYLGKSRWFDLFRCYRKKDIASWLYQLKLRVIFK